MVNLGKFRDAQSCRQRALACREQAATSGPDHQPDFLDLAAAWERLADQYERLERSVHPGRTQGTFHTRTDWTSP